MKLARFNQYILDCALRASLASEPITLCGMYDCGVDFLSQRFLEYFQAQKDPGIVAVYIDLSAVSTKDKVVQEISFSLCRSFPQLTPGVDYLGITKQLQELSKKTKIVLIVYAGQEGGTDPEFFEFLHRIHNLLRYQVSYCLFVTTRLLTGSSPVPPLVADKVMKRNLVPIPSRNEEDSRTIIENFEEIYNTTFPEKQKKLIVYYSGGTPGLIKACCLQVVDNPKWQEPNIGDERLFFRLQGVANDLPVSYQQILLHPNEKKIDTVKREFLLRYGYLKKTNDSFEIFTPLLETFMKQYGSQISAQPFAGPTDVQKKLLALTLSQRKVFDYLSAHPSELVTRDALAQVLWGASWADRYSDWAIDQLLSGLRDKLPAIGKPGKIVTKKGEGIIFILTKHTK